jgi:lysyl-tRNA synthetase, class II
LARWHILLSGEAAVGDRIWRRLDRDGHAVGLVVWATRLVGLLAVLAVTLPPVHRLRPPVADLLGLPYPAHIAALVIIAVAGVGLLSLATGLRRRKRRAWQLAILAAGLIALLQLVLRHAPLAAIAAVALVALLLAGRGEFTGLPDTSVGRWRALLVFVQFALGGVLIGFLVLTFGMRWLVGHPPVTARLEHAVLALVGVSGPVAFHAEVLDDLTATIGLSFGIAAVALSGYFLLRSAEPRPAMSTDDRQRLRRLLDAHGHHDSLAYFALRPDKSVAFSPTGKAAVTYRALAGVAMASGDPIGDPEAWPGAVAAFLGTCRRHGWVPAVLGCSELGAIVWSRHGLRVLELGDEAVVDVTTFALDGRAMRGVRQLAARARRAGYSVRVRRVAQLDPAERATLAGLARRWRGSEPERGFSMALGRVADPNDPDSVVVTAEDGTGQVAGMLQLVPWAADGLSLDVMRRDRGAAAQGLNELMIAELLVACRDLGVRRVSLNFAAFRAALERGGRIGAGPVALLWARLLRWASRWWQIESLYRFNAKFQPQWVSRYLVFPAARDLPRVALAALEAEGFGGRPPVVLRLLRRTHAPADTAHDPLVDQA